MEGSPKVNQLVDFISRAIVEGRLLPGSRLPSLRDFCDQITISKYTVVEALERLRASGLVTSSQGRGYFVSRSRTAFESELEKSIPIVNSDLHSRLKHAFAKSTDVLRPGCGFLPERWLDTELFRKALRQTIRKPQLKFSEYGNPRGYLPLRKTLQMKMSEAGINVPVDHIILTSSTMNAIDMLFRILLRPGDTVLLDDPCYFNFHASLRQHHANVVFAPRGYQGVTKDVFEMLLKKYRPRVFLTSGLMHNPTGHSYTLEEMFSLITLLNQYDCHLIEDDLYHDLLEPSPKPMAALAGLANASYISGFSKLLSANMRVAYIATSAQLSEELIQLKSLTGGVTCEFTEQTLYQFFRDGSYNRHQRRLASNLSDASSRVKCWLQAAGCRFPVAHPNGLFLWAELPGHIDSESLAETALQHGIALAPGTLFCQNPDGLRYMRFNIAHSDNPVVKELVTRLLNFDISHSSHSSE
ncbi:PLP-dependent aminotransferase family protein [Dickeya undicola]|uniref:PLP-dependent aminotransferase family protein n=1 Tax=Dickeya undicola TaxID=1577887 RepID=A0A3N0FYU5_9GAMM|nr:PLP-dependent aminotransferase family protein [Dickeya undicola]RNM05161.1 PLP-dependent aminotransferase family protein [Dickeya undicola]